MFFRLKFKKIYLTLFFSLYSCQFDGYELYILSLSFCKLFCKKKKKGTKVFNGTHRRLKSMTISNETDRLRLLSAHLGAWLEKVTLV